jgi:hypothetical protein
MIFAPDDPNTWLLTTALWLLGLFISLLLAYLVIRLAITHGMLSYSRRLEEDRGARVFRD